MPRIATIVNRLIEAKQTELTADRAQLKKLKGEATTSGGATPEHLQKAINALRTTIANGQEDLQDLQSELADTLAYEASAAGQLHRLSTREKLKTVDALIDVCITTAGNADIALNAAWAALRRHQIAHTALNGAIGTAYGAVTEGSGFDIHHDQMFLMRSYSSLSNSGPALAEWLIEALQGYELENFIKVSGVQLHHNQHETLQGADAGMLNRCWNRMKEIATRCGVEVHGEDDPDLPVLRNAALEVVTKAKL